MINWHRLFGLALTDFFTESAWVVELEKDLSLKRQLLDVVILRREKGTNEASLPDGMDNLKKYNLLSYKSLREPFDDWALKELTGHYVNYRKQISPSFNDLLPEEEFQLYGVSTRFPQKLSSQLELKPIQEGVYEIVRGNDDIRLIVLSEIPHGEHNAIWHLFSGIPGEVEFAARHYRGHSQEISTLLNQLFENYQLEGLEMAYSMEDFQKDYVREHLGVLSNDEILKRFSWEDRLKGLSNEDRLKGLSNEDRLKGLSNEDRLKGLSLEEIQGYLEKQ